jgi:LmbE family N-acetylglucosaminyl deacetylase
MHPPKLHKSGVEAPRLLRLVHRVTHRMPLGLRRIEKQRVLVVASRPGDEAIAVGGCLALHRRAGSAIVSVFVTSGGTVRAGATNLGSGVEHHFLEVPRAALWRREKWVSEKLAEVIRGARPDVIFSPFPGEGHRGHAAIAASTDVASFEASFRGELWCYETWSALWPNWGVDITGVVDEKRAAIERARPHVSLPHVEAALGLNRYRGLKLGVDFAEAVFVCRAPLFRSLCQTLAGVWA